MYTDCITDSHNFIYQIFFFIHKKITQGCFQAMSGHVAKKSNL